MNLSDDEIYAIKHLVSQWLRVRAQNPQSRNQSALVDMVKLQIDRGDTEGAVRSLFTQLAADADHSALLHRLLSGKDPLPEAPPLKYSYPDYPD